MPYISTGLVATQVFMSLVSDVHRVHMFFTPLVFFTTLVLMEKIDCLSTYHVEQARGQNVDRLLHNLVRNN